MRIGLDLDGTILDCKPRQIQLYAALCRACALLANVEQYWSLKREGHSNRSAMREMGIDDHFARAVAALWEHAVEDMFWLRFDVVLPRIIDTLCAWRKSGNSLHLISARRNRALAGQQLRLLRLDAMFATIDFVSPYDTAAKEPVMTELHLDLYIGDTECDARAAMAAGVPPVLVSSGMRSEAYLKKTGDWLIVDNLACVHPAIVTPS